MSLGAIRVSPVFFLRDLTSLQEYADPRGTQARESPHESQSISAAVLRQAAQRPHEVHMTMLTVFTSFPPL